MRTGMRLRWLAIVVILIGPLPPAARGGSLLPPPGPVRPTMKPLDQIEPRTPIRDLSGSETSLFVIDAPGSYYLTGAIRGEAGKNGIEVRADNVTLDLNGFTLEGTPGSLDGILSGPATDNLTVRNGTIHGWGGSGINAWKSVNCIMESLVVSHSAAAGVIAGKGSRITGCAANENARTGISGGIATVVEHCTAIDNGEAGISIQPHGTVQSSVAESNGGRGIQVLDGGAIADCVASVNGLEGIYAGAGSGVRDCISFDNERGILAEDGSSVVGCAVRENKAEGILVWSDCRIAGNHLFGNGNGASPAAGILVTGSRSRIEGNHLVGNRVGIEVTGTGNLILGNSAAGSGEEDFRFGEGNAYGPIVDAGSGGPIPDAACGSNVRF